VTDLLETYDYKTRTYKRLTGTEDWVTVADLGEGGYEWAIFRAFYSPSARRYFWHGDAGCSCNDWNEDLSTSADFENGDKNAMLRAWETFTKAHSYDFGVSEYQSGVGEIRSFKEPK
jgi:hypothetical protein